MSENSIPKGIVPPVLTPLKPDQSIDVEAFKLLLKRVVNGGSSAVFIAGTAGLGSALSTADYELVVSTALEHVPDDVPVLCGVLESSTMRAMERIQLLDSLNAQHFVTVTPYYMPATKTDALLRHFGYLREQTSMNMVLYNIPVCTQTEIPVEVVIECAKLGWSKTCKDSSGNADYFAKLCDQGREFSLSMYQGMRPDFALLHDLGAAGCVPVTANVFPTLFADAWNARSNSEKSAELQDEIDNIWSEFVLEGDFISRSIDALAAKGIGSGTKMLPL